MLKLFETTPGTAIMSLRTGGPISTIVAPIINPNNLFIEGWFTQDNRSGEKLILVSSDIREVLPQGFVVNDHEVLTHESELVRLKDIITLRFDLINLKVVSENGTKYGKINDYAYETKNMFIQKMYAAQPLVKNFSGGTLSIDRSQIVEVTDKRLIIEDPTELSRSQAMSTGATG